MSLPVAWSISTLRDWTRPSVDSTRSLVWSKVRSTGHVYKTIINSVLKSFTYDVPTGTSVSRVHTQGFVHSKVPGRRSKATGRISRICLPFSIQQFSIPSAHIIPGTAVIIGKRRDECRNVKWSLLLLFDFQGLHGGAP